MLCCVQSDAPSSTKVSSQIFPVNARRSLVRKQVVVTLHHESVDSKFPGCRGREGTILCAHHQAVDRATRCLITQQQQQQQMTGGHSRAHLVGTEGRSGAYGDTQGVIIALLHPDVWLTPSSVVWKVTGARTQLSRLSNRPFSSLGTESYWRNRPRFHFSIPALTVLYSCPRLDHSPQFTRLSLCQAPWLR